MKYICPVCFFDAMPYPPKDYDICPCCATEFGNDDADHTHEELRRIWVANGAQWFYERPPANWNPWLQLIAGGHADLIPQQLSLYRSVWGNVGICEAEVVNESNVLESHAYENAEAFSLVG